MKQRILSLFIATAMILMLIPVSAFADGEESGHNHVVDGYCAVDETGTPSSDEETYDENAPDVAYIGETGYKSLSAAIKNAADGDSIQIQSDIYITKSITVDKTIYLSGNYTIYRGFSGDALFNITSGGKICLNDITIDGDKTNYSGYSLFNVLSGGKLVISSGTILKNSRAGYGGAVYIAAGGTLSFEAGTITQCTADYAGGAIYNEGTVYLYGSATITGNTSACGGAIRTSGNVYVEGYISATDNTDFNGSANNIHLDGSGLHIGEQPLEGAVGVSPHDTSAIEGMTIGYNDYLYDGANHITYDADNSYYGVTREDGSIILTQGQNSSDPEPVTEQDTEPEEAPIPDVTYVVTFVTAHGSVIPSEFTVNDGATVAQPTDPSEEGWVFGGWYTDEACTTLYDFSSPVTGYLILYAKWTEAAPEYVYVTFDLNGHGTIVPQGEMLTPGDTAQQPDDPTDDAYNFTGWYTNADCTEQFSFDTPINSDITLYAGWTEIPPTYFSVTFDTQTEEVAAPDAQSVESGLYAADPGTLTRTGYTFDGWYADGAENAFDFANTPITDNITLYAHWTEILPTYYSVTFNTQAEDVAAPDAQSVESGLYAADPGTLTRTGYTFDGWYADGAETVFDFANTQITDNITLYAHWTEIPPATYVVTFVTTHGSVTPGEVTVNDGETVAQPADPSEEGWTFGGWYTDEACTTQYDFSSPVTAYLILYAKWTEAAPEHVYVTFNLNGHGTVVPQGETLTPGDKAQKPDDPTDDAYNFTGWCTDAACTTLFSFDTQINSDITLYAGWAAKPVTEEYTVTFVTAHGSVTPSEVQVKKGERVAQPTAPSEEGWIFGGWYTDEACTTQYDFNRPVTGYLILYAKWTERPADTYTVTFSTAHGSVSPSQVSVKKGEKVAQPANPTETGWVFEGWYTDQTYAKQFDFNSAINSNTTIYAKWSEVKATYSVTFYTKYGTTPQGQLVVSGEKAVKPADPVQTGWIFGGWFTDEACTAQYDFNTAVTSSMTLYAKWTQVPVTYYTVTFVNSKGTAPSAQSIENGKMAVKPNDPTCEGFVFGGWYTDQDCKNMYNFTTAVTGNITLYAKWTELPSASYSVSFNANGHGTAPNPQTVKSGEKVSKPTDPTATGYVFGGWFTDTQCTTAYNFNDAVSANLQLYAKWTAIRYTVKFDANGGSGTMQSQTYVYDSAAVLPANTLTRTGYTFAGWNTKADGSGTAYEDKGQIKNLTETSGATVNLYAQWKNLYNLIEGINAKYQKGATTTLLFRLDGDYSKFTGITIDGNNVATTQYDSWFGATTGGTYVEIHADYLNQMPTGTHTIKFLYTDGSCETTIEVVSPTAPKTGDTNNAVLWIIIAIAALIVIAVVVLIILIRRRKKDDDFDGDDDRDLYDR